MPTLKLSDAKFGMPAQAACSGRQEQLFRPLAVLPARTCIPIQAAEGGRHPVSPPFLHEADKLSEAGIQCDRTDDPQSMTGAPMSLSAPSIVDNAFQ